MMSRQQPQGSLNVRVFQEIEDPNLVMEYRVIAPRGDELRASPPSPRMRTSLQAKKMPEV